MVQRKPVWLFEHETEEMGVWLTRLLLTGIEGGRRASKRRQVGLANRQQRGDEGGKERRSDGRSGTVRRRKETSNSPGSWDSRLMSWQIRRLADVPTTNTATPTNRQSWGRNSKETPPNPPLLLQDSPDNCYKVKERESEGERIEMPPGVSEAGFAHPQSSQKLNETLTRGQLPFQEVRLTTQITREKPTKQTGQLQRYRITKCVCGLMV